jgi:hypothetical protein
MHHRYFGWLGALLCCACALLTIPGRACAAEAPNDPFSAMRVRRIAPPISTVKLVLNASDGSRLRLSDLRGKAVLVEFFIAN